MPAAASRGLKLFRQLIPTRITMLSVLGLVDPDRVLDDLSRDPVIVNIAIAARVRNDLRAIDRDNTRADQTSLGAEPEHPAEQLAQRLLVPANEPSDSRVIRWLPVITR
jgi:hypothetical protein